MVKKIFKVAISLIMFTIFYFVFGKLYSMNVVNVQGYLPSFAVIIASCVVGIIFYFLLSSFITDLFIKRIDAAESRLAKIGTKELIFSVVGCIIGLLIANLIGLALNGYGVIGSGITVLLNIVLGYLGIRLANIKKDEVTSINLGNLVKDSRKSNTYGRPKILDTSVIIDGRILDILQTRFIEGKIIIPNFVLEELRHIADSSDALKRNRGRRGLDILNQIQKQLLVTVEIVDFNTKEDLEVDSKLLKMAQKLDAFVVTNDYNLNKVAEFQGVQVLNINELANAIKPVVLPGEDMRVTVIKDGKEKEQGIAYLNDGTMIVIEGGAKNIGDTIDVVVTSVLQTAAGRMIFTRKK